MLGVANPLPELRGPAGEKATADPARTARAMEGGLNKLHYVYCAREGLDRCVLFCCRERLLTQSFVSLQLQNVLSFDALPEMKRRIGGNIYVSLLFLMTKTE